MFQVLKVLDKFVTLLRDRGVDLSLKEQAEFETIANEAGLALDDDIDNADVKVLADALSRHRLNNREYRARRAAPIDSNLRASLHKRGVLVASLCPTPDQLRSKWGKALVEMCTDMSCRIDFTMPSLPLLSKEEQDECGREIRRRHRQKRGISRALVAVAREAATLSEDWNNRKEEGMTAREALEKMKTDTESDETRRRVLVGLVIAFMAILVGAMAALSFFLKKYNERVTRWWSNANFA